MKPVATVRILVILLLWPIFAQAATTYVALGDSLTFGEGDEFGLGYPERLIQRLQAQDPSAVIHNLGRPGWATSELISGASWDTEAPGSQLSQAESLIASAIGEGRSGAALVWTGSNDLWATYGWGDQCNAESPPECEQYVVDEFSSDVETILSRLTDAGAQVFIALLDDHSHRPISAEVIDESQQALLSGLVTTFNQVITDRAAAFGAQTVDFFNTRIFESVSTLFEDGNHPSATGYDAVASVWYAAITDGIGCQETVYDATNNSVTVPLIFVGEEMFAVDLDGPFSLLSLEEGHGGCKSTYDAVSGEGYLPNVWTNGYYFTVLLAPPYYPTVLQTIAP